MREERKGVPGSFSEILALHMDLQCRPKQWSVDW